MKLHQLSAIHPTVVPLKREGESAMISVLGFAMLAIHRSSTKLSEANISAVKLARTSALLLSLRHATAVPRPSSERAKQPYVKRCLGAFIQTTFPQLLLSILTTSTNRLL